MAELTRRDRLQVTARLDELAEEIDAIARWLDTFGDDADKPRSCWSALAGT